MENTVPNIAVISFPRTASKWCVKYYAKKYNKQRAMGILHKAEYLTPMMYGNEAPTKEKIREVVFGFNHVLHGHWHTLHLLDDDVIDCLKTKYKIVTTYYPYEKTYENFLNVTNTSDSTLFDQTMEATIEERKNWTIWKHHLVDGDGDPAEVDELPVGYA